MGQSQRAETIPSIPSQVAELLPPITLELLNIWLLLEEEVVAVTKLVVVVLEDLELVRGLLSLRRHIP